MSTVSIKNNLCKGCQLCMAFCPKKILHPSEKLNEMGYHYAEAKEPHKCTGCLVCTLMCPEVAIEVYDE